MSETGPEKQRILVVDDESSVTNLLIELLGGRYDVDVAHNGQQAAAMLADTHRQRPDLVLLDLMMPGMDGFETCRRIRLLERCQDIPIIFVTGYGDPERIVQGFAAGGADYVTKPFDPAVLQARIGVHLALRRSNAALARANRALHEELSWAGELQRQLLSIEMPASEHAAFSVSYVPLPDLHCGGDYYDVFTLAPRRYLVLLGDVSGHGLRAAFLTVMLKSLIYRGWIRSHLGNLELSAFFGWLNQRLCEQLERIPGVFVSFLAFSLDLERRTACFCNAGQHPPLILRTTGPLVVTARGMPLGVHRTAGWQAEEVALKPGDRIVAYTDGLAEAGDGSVGAGIAELLQSCSANPQYTEAVIAEAKRRAGEASFKDDVTIVSVLLRS